MIRNNPGIQFRVQRLPKLSRWFQNLSDLKINTLIRNGNVHKLNHAKMGKICMKEILTERGSFRTSRWQPLVDGPLIFAPSDWGPLRLAFVSFEGPGLGKNVSCSLGCSTWLMLISVNGPFRDVPGAAKSVHFFLAAWDKISSFGPISVIPIFVSSASVRYCSESSVNLFTENKYELKNEYSVNLRL